MTQIIIKYNCKYIKPIFITIYKLRYDPSKSSFKINLANDLSNDHHYWIFQHGLQCLQKLRASGTIYDSVIA